MRNGVHRALISACVTAAAAAAAAEDIAYTAQRDRAAAEVVEVVVDSRPLADCRRLSLAGARCLPADDFLGPQRRLPAERDILWLLGTAGLDGSEAVLVVGETPAARDFVGGLLYLAGQRRVRILDAPLTRELEADKAAAPGAERGMVRSAVFTAPMRAERLVLKHELMQAAAPALIDGRSGREYRGETRRGARGGRLPGAASLPATTLSRGGPPVAPLPADAIAYAHDAFEGIGYFTRLVAGAGLPLRVYAGGWAEWAADARLPVDAASAPEPRAAASAAEAPLPVGTASLPLALATAGALLAALAGVWHVSQRRAA